MRGELQAALTIARSVPAEELPRLLGDLEEVRATALLRLSGPTMPVAKDELLAIEEASRRLSVSRGYLYRHHQQFPFTRRVGRKLLFSAHGIDQHIRRTGALTPRLYSAKVPSVR